MHDPNQNTLQNPMMGAGEEWPEDGSVPEQMGGGGPRIVLKPGIYDFKLPDSLVQCMHVVKIRDNREYLKNGTANPTGPLGQFATVDPNDPTKRLGAEVERLQLKFDRNAPLVVVGGAHDGVPMTATITSNPRPRGKKADLSTPWISDLAMLVVNSLQDPRRPVEIGHYQQILPAYAGRVVRLETGLTAQCRPDKVRYIQTYVPGPNGQPEIDPSTGRPKVTTVQDPSGKKGCGKRYYTSDFANPAGGFDTAIACTCGTPTPAEAAAGYRPVVVELRGFEQIERFLPPVGAEANQAAQTAPVPMQAPPMAAPQPVPQYAPPMGQPMAPVPQQWPAQPQGVPAGYPQGYPQGYPPQGGNPGSRGV